MAWGVLEDHKMATVPGTVILEEGKEATLDGTGTLKRYGKIALAPQPSDSPNDPLNWPMWQKNAVIGILALASSMAVGMSVMLTPAFQLITKTYHISFSTASIFLVGTLVLAGGVGTFFTSAAATLWGKRPVFLFSTLVLLICCVWGFWAGSFAPLAAMRIVQGVASAPLETLLASVIGDVFFVHQRGSKLGIWGFMFLSGVCIGQIVAGYIVQRMGVKWTFAFCALAIGLVLPAMFFFVPEMVYNRPERESFELVTTAFKTLDGNNKSVKVEITEVGDVERPEQKLPYRTRLHLFRGRFSSQSFWRVLLRPFSLIFYPAVIYSTFVHGAFHTWMVTFHLVQMTILVGPAYHLRPSQIGLTTLPSFGAGLVTVAFAGWFADWLARSMSRHNKGIYEPEFRLLLMIPAVILSTIGLVGFGISVEQHAPIWQLLLFSTLYHVAVPFASAASFTYIIDCHQDEANQAFVVINFVKTLVTFTATFFINGWLERVGAKKMCMTIAIVNIAVSLLTTPTYVYGKRFRSFVARRQ